MIIVFEGIDGSGKTTISKRLFQEFQNVFPGQVFWFSEPSPTELGKSLKNILTSKDIQLTTFEQSLLFTADRSFLLRSYVIPYSLEGKIVIMDRSFVSTYAYQIMNIEDKKETEILTNLTEYSISSFIVDILFYLDCPADISLSRITTKDGIESRGKDFIERVRKNYLDFISKKHNSLKRIIKIDSTQAIDKVYEEVRSMVMEKVGYIA